MTYSPKQRIPDRTQKTLQRHQSICFKSGTYKGNPKDDTYAMVVPVLQLSINSWIYVHRIQLFSYAQAHFASPYGKT